MRPGLERDLAILSRRYATRVGNGEPTVAERLGKREIRAPFGRVVELRPAAGFLKPAPSEDFGDEPERVVGVSVVVAMLPFRQLDL